MSAFGNPYQTLYTASFIEECRFSLLYLLFGTCKLHIVRPRFLSETGFNILLLGEAAGDLEELCLWE